MEDIASLAAVLTPGSELSCTTTQGDVLRGNVVATDEAVGVVVISILANGAGFPREVYIDGLLDASM